MLKVLPKINRRFADFFREVFRKGALDRKTKELIAIAASLTAGCGPCLEIHAKRARRFGATDEEICEAVAVAEIIAAGRVRAMVQASTLRPVGQEESKPE